MEVRVPVTTAEVEARAWAHDPKVELEGKLYLKHGPGKSISITVSMANIAEIELHGLWLLATERAEGADGEDG